MDSGYPHRMTSGAVDLPLALALGELTRPYGGRSLLAHASPYRATTTEGAPLELWQPTTRLTTVFVKERILHR